MLISAIAKFRIKNSSMPAIELLLTSRIPTAIDRIRFTPVRCPVNLITYRCLFLKSKIDRWKNTVECS